MGINALQQWIEMAEFIFQCAMKNNVKQKIQWFFPINVQAQEAAKSSKKK